MGDSGVLFFDVGGVLATNGWDRHARRNCVDDRPLNLECAALLGMNTVHFETVEQLQQDLDRLGVGT